MKQFVLAAVAVALATSGLHALADNRSAASHDSPNKMSSADKIKVVDTDGDGILSAQEHETGSRRMFEKMDSDRDGALTVAEIAAGHKTMMRKTN